MEDCPCQSSGHFCMECEREMIAEMKQREREESLKIMEIKQQVIVDGITHLINVEKTVQKMIEAGYLNLDLFEKIYKEEKRKKNLMNKFWKNLTLLIKLTTLAIIRGNSGLKPLKLLRILLLD